MYYSSGNYEAFARPRKPEGVDNKSAHIIGTGLAALTAACYLVRDGQMQGQNIHIYEKDPNYSLCRATVNQGQDAHTDGKFGLSDKEIGRAHV